MTSCTFTKIKKKCSLGYPVCKDIIMLESLLCSTAIRVYIPGTSDLTKNTAWGLNSSTKPTEVAVTTGYTCTYSIITIPQEWNTGRQYWYMLHFSSIFHSFFSLLFSCLNDIVIQHRNHDCRGIQTSETHSTRLYCPSFIQANDNTQH